MAGDEPVEGSFPAEGGEEKPVYTDNPYKARSGEGDGEKDEKNDSRKERSDDRDRSRKDRHRERSRERSPRERERDRDKDKKESKDRDREKGKDRERDKDRKSRRHRSRSKSKSRHRSRSPRERRRRAPRQSGFDQPPATGFSTAPDGAALLPGASAEQVAQLASLSLPGLPLGGIRPQAMTQQATRHARRVYVGGLPPLANEQTVARFFSQALAAVGGTSHIAAGADAVVNVYINAEKKFAFVEFRTVEETSNAMALDGIMFEGVSVRVRRPNDYNPAMAATLGPATPSQTLNLSAIGLTPGMAGNNQNTADGPDRIFVGGLPYYLPEDQIRDLLGQFGILKGFDLVKDRETGNSKGYGFAVYEDPAVVDLACAGLNGLAMGDKTLTVRRATAAGQAKPDTADVIMQAQQQIALSMAMQAGGIMPGMTLPGPPPTRVVSLLDVVDVKELTDDVAYSEIMEDMQDECGKYGTVLKLLIPRPQPDGTAMPGVGKVYVEYDAVEGAMKARGALNGRKFAGKAVKAEFCDETRFADGEFE